MILYFDIPRFDTDRDGKTPLSSAEKRKWKVSTFYYLGRTDENLYAYGTEPTDKLPEPDLSTFDLMLERLEEVGGEPAIYGEGAIIADLVKRMRAIKLAPASTPPPATATTPGPATPVFLPDAHIPKGPLPKGAVPAKVALAPFNNGKPANGATWFGATTGDGKYDGKDWPKAADMTAMLALGVKAVRVPLRLRYCFNWDGTLNTWVIGQLASRVKENKAKGVSTVLDAHEYLPFTDPIIFNAWMRLGVAMEKAIGGPNPFFGIEVSNEPGKGSENLANWTEPLRSTIKAIRVSGYQGYIFAGAGDWNNITFLPKAFAEIERTGGVAAMDPYDSTIYTGHDYWNKSSDPAKTRNDQGSAVNGALDLAARYNPAFAAARRIGAKVCMSEIGGGISPAGPLPAYQGIGKDGLVLQNEYFALAKANEDVLIGTWFWMGGDCGETYRHKIAAGNPHTKSLQRFW
jgi:hypothetical protein